MRRASTKLALAAALGTFSLGLGASLTGVASGQVKAPHSARVTVVKVTLGAPSELGITLSKWSALPAGVVTFKVTNMGTVAHNFKVCTKVVTTSKANACLGKATPNLAAGKSATLTVTLTVKGKYEFLCSLPGHAGGGMKGLIGVGVRVPVPTSQASATGGSNTGGGGGGGGGAGGGGATTCASPQNTSVDVNEFDFGFTLSRSSVPCGKVTFTQRNTGMVDHNFDINGLAMPIIHAGETSTNTFTLTPGTARYICDVPGHDGLGMSGTLTVTG
jgi:uncharacterized cupredoxin-like copper-binding protein